MTIPVLRLSLNIHPVGPRPAIADPRAWLALNVAAAYDGPNSPTQPGDERLIPALMPRVLLEGAPADPREFVLLLFSPTSYVSIVVTVPTPAETAFSTRVGDRVRADAERMASLGQLTVGWGGEHMDTEGDVEDVAAGPPRELPPPKPHPWFGIASLLAALPAGLAQPLRARWFLDLEVPRIRNALNADPTLHSIVVAPRIVRDGNRGVPYVLQVAQPVLDATGSVTLTYRAATHPDLQAQIVPLDVTHLFSGAPTDPGDYWLKVDDSRADSVAEIDQLLRDNGDPTTLAALLTAETLQRAIRPQGHSLRVSGAVVSAFRQAAASLASRLTPLERTQHAEKFASDILETPRIAGARTLVAPTAGAIAAWWRRQWQNMESEIVNGRVPYADTPPLQPDDFGLDAQVLARDLEELVEGLLRIGAQAGPVRGIEGLDFVVGPSDGRLVSYDASLNQTRTAENEQAQIGLMVRRASSSDFSQASWRIVTAGQPVLDEDGVLRKYPWGSPETLVLPVDDTLAINGIPLAYKDGVLRHDDTFRGQLIGGPNALLFLHGNQGTGPGNPIDWTEPGEVVYASSAVRHEIAGWEHTRAPVLRYDDHYQLAAFMKDRGGGLPRDIAPNQPWVPQVANVTVPATVPTTVHFQRRVPVGALNLKPGGPLGWPALPKDVVLRATEWWQGHARGQAAPPVVLFSRAVNTGSGDAPEYPGTVYGYEFTVEPARISEHTLERWAFPKIGAMDAQAQVALLKRELARIAAARKALQAEPHAPTPDVDALLPHDPAVSALLVRVQEYGPDGQPAAAPSVHFHALTAPDAQLPFHKAALTVRVSTGPSLPGILVIQPPLPGNFSAVEVSLLCRERDHARFDISALKYDEVPSYVGPDGNYRVHEGETVLLETATAELPTPEALYEGLAFHPDASGHVIGTFNGTVASLAHVDRFELQRQRWTWRNLPYVTPGGPADLPRRLASGLPIELSAVLQESRDSAAAVITFDLMASIDRGFVERPRHQARWPRTEDGLPASDAKLIADGRDGLTAADYLRYALTVVSRYAGVLPPDRQRVVAAPRPLGQELSDTRGPWKRVAVRNSGTAELRALNILAILPLTATPRGSPDAHLDGVSKDATPHLVILDEIWFREYGPGEGIRAQLALEDIEIGDGQTRPIRYGPMPHKHLLPSGNTQQLTDEAAEADVSLRLPMFGPFGYSLDRSGNEALANATAFVMYLPAGVGPQWSAAVRFRRVLAGIGSDGAMDERLGPWSSSHLLYSLADSRSLVKPRTEERAVLELSVGPSGAPTGAIQFHNADAQLMPYRRAGQAPDPRIQRQYRYVLVVGRPAKDGGHGVHAFIPEHALWLDSERLARSIGWTTLSAGASLQGYVLELELDSDFLVQQSPLEAQAISMKSLLKALLRTRLESGSQTGRDALGRITRVSDSFDVRVVQTL